RSTASLPESTNSQGFAPGPVIPHGEVRPIVNGLVRPIVEFTAVTRLYGARRALDDVHFALHPGELAFLVGPSGAGKTTLLKLVNREIRPSSGEVCVAGIAAHRLKASRVADLRRKVGVVFQDYKLLPRLTALENVAFGLQVGDLRIFEDIAAWGTAVLVATHNVEIVTRLQRRVLTLVQGRLVRDQPAGQTGRMAWLASS